MTLFTAQLTPTGLMSVKSTKATTHTAAWLADGSDFEGAAAGQPGCYKGRRNGKVSGRRSYCPFIAAVSLSTL
jgi:hypothetical protein